MESLRWIQCNDLEMYWTDKALRKFQTQHPEGGSQL